MAANIAIGQPKVPVNTAKALSSPTLANVNGIVSKRVAITHFLIVFIAYL